MFRTIPLYVIGSFSLYTQQWCISCQQEFYSKNKFEKLMHLVDFIIRIALFMYLNLTCLHWHLFSTDILNQQLFLIQTSQSSCQDSPELRWKYP